MNNKPFKIAVAIIAFGVFVGMAFGDGQAQRPSAYVPVHYFNRTGEIEFPGGQKVFMDTMVPTTASGFVIDISKAGFDTIQAVYLMCQRNTTDPTAVPEAAIKTLTNTTLTVNITQGNNSTVNVLGSLVQLGAGKAMATNVSDMKLFVTLRGK